VTVISGGIDNTPSVGTGVGIAVGDVYGTAVDGGIEGNGAAVVGIGVADSVDGGDGVGVSVGIA
jgi:hypothetical protein